MCIRDRPTTQELLDVLKENDAVATFFTIGEQISDKTDYVETIKRMAAEGHQIGTHSYDQDVYKRQAT